LHNTEIKSEKRGRFSSRRLIFLVLIGSLSLAALAAASPGYLPCIGPASLRFRPVPAPVTNQFVLPAPEPLPEPAAIAPKPEIPTPPAPVIVPPEPAAVTNQVSSAPAGSPPPDEVVSPQMLLRYFSKSTNGTSSGIIAPMDFTPPKAVDPASSSSKATYSTGP
jgi:hypothetical protein